MTERLPHWKMVERFDRPFLSVVANLDRKDSSCRVWAWNKAPAESKRRFFELIRQGASALAVQRSDRATDAP